MNGLIGRRYLRKFLAEILQMQEQGHTLARIHADLTQRDPELKLTLRSFGDAVRFLKKNHKQDVQSQPLAETRKMTKTVEVASEPGQAKLDDILNGKASTPDALSQALSNRKSTWSKK